MMEKLAEIGQAMKKGSFFVTFTTKLDPSFFSVIEELRLRMSWGDADVFVHKRS